MATFLACPTIVELSFGGEGKIMQRVSHRFGRALGRYVWSEYTGRGVCLPFCSARQRDKIGIVSVAAAVAAGVCESSEVPAALLLDSRGGSGKI